ncbi:inhibitor of apoptosis-promoting Bax1-domain-containing protein [Syncephalis plumigaleata]|nr:inhibitor of apoptosis-promoting Bax1-domain-containing protein [Syncephalis plumigaleata]
MSFFGGSSSTYGDSDTGRFRQSGYNFEALKATQAISPDTQRHLVKVYAALAGCSTLAAIGARTHLYSYWLRGGMLSGLLCFISVIGVLALPQSKAATPIRYGLLSLFAFCQGLSLGPLIETILDFYPRVLVTALVSTTLVFVSFSMSALFSRRRSWFFLGGLLGSGLSILCWSSFLNIWIQSATLFRAELYIGLAIFCGYVIYDTQLIIEKAELGYRDIPGDCISLFTDLIGMFIRILAILADQEEKKRKRSRQNEYRSRDRNNRYWD